MLASFSEFKFFQSFRIPVEKIDGLRCLIEIEAENDKQEYIEDANLIDISVSGLGFSSKQRISLNTELTMSIQFKKDRIDITGRIVRAFTDSVENNGIIYGVELDEEKKLNRFLEQYILSLNSDRLKNCLIDSTLKDRYTQISEGFEVFSLLLSLFKDITLFGDREEFVNNMMEEVIRVMNAQRSTVFLINPETNELEATSALGIDTETLKFDYRLGIAGSVFTTGVALNIDTNRDRTRFNKEFDKKFNFETKSIICHPIHNGEDKIIGVIEVINKRNQDRFSIEDEKTMKVLSLIFSSVYHTFNPISEKSKVRTFSTAYDRKNALIGRSAHLTSIRKSIVKVKDIDSPLLLIGEKGTGKTLLARIVHTEGSRGLFNLKVIHCESETQEDLREMLISKDPENNKLILCQGGTVVLHEISRLSLELQEELYEILINRGMEDSIYSIDLRLISISSEDLGDLVDNGLFCRKLYKYISRSLINVEPIRRRGSEDIDMLIDYFLKIECKREGLLLKSFSDKAMKILREYPWPGNIDELKTCVERAVLYNPKTHVISDINLKNEAAALINLSAENKMFEDIAYADDSALLLKERVILIEREIILSEIKKQDGNKTKAARAMGISREALRKKILSSNAILVKLKRSAHKDNADEYDILKAA